MLKGHTAWVNALVFSPNCQRLATSSEDRTVRLWDTKTGRSVWCAQALQVPVETLGFSPDGRLLAGAGPRNFDPRMPLRRFDGPNLFLWDVASHKLIADDVADVGGIGALAFAPDGRYIALGGEIRIGLWSVRERD